MSETNILNNSIERKIKRASMLSVFVSLFVLSFKTLAYFKTNSQAIFSDALESIVNVVASIVALWVVHVSSEPADDKHPYGHGKLEYFSAAFEGGLVCFAGIMIIAEAIHALIVGDQIHNFEMGFIYSIIASLFNLLLGLYLKHVGRSCHSTALESSGTHVLSDLWTTAGSLLGLGLVWITNVLWIDALSAIIMAIFLLLTGYKVVRSAFGGLLDEHDRKSLEQLAMVIEKNRFPGIIDLHQTRIIRAGRFHHIDSHVVVPKFWDVNEAHQQTNQFEYDVVTDYHLEGEIAFHIDPCSSNYCAQCELKHCPVRSHEFVSRDIVNWESLTRKPLLTTVE